MSISQPVNSRMRNHLYRHARLLLFLSALIALFGAVYEHFSFGVWSFYMVYAFAPCLLGGLWLLLECSRKKMPGQLFLGLLDSAIIVMTLGMVVRGVVEIYGTENRLLIAYPVLGFSLLAAACIVRLIDIQAHLSDETG